MTDIDRLYHKIKSRWNFRRQQADATVEELKFLVELLDEMERDDFAKDTNVPTKWISVKDRMPPNDDTKVMTYGNPVTH